MTNPRQRQKSRPSKEVQSHPNEQSGSTGRKAGDGDPVRDGTDTGQDDYGMTGGRDRIGNPAGDSVKSDDGGAAGHGEKAALRPAATDALSKQRRQRKK